MQGRLLANCSLFWAHKSQVLPCLSQLECCSVKLSYYQTFRWKPTMYCPLLRIRKKTEIAVTWDTIGFPSLQLASCVSGTTTASASEGPFSGFHMWVVILWTCLSYSHQVWVQNMTQSSCFFPHAIIWYLKDSQRMPTRYRMVMVGDGKDMDRLKWLRVSCSEDMRIQSCIQHAVTTWSQQSSWLHAKSIGFFFS